ATTPRFGSSVPEPSLARQTPWRRRRSCPGCAIGLGVIPSVLSVVWATRSEARRRRGPRDRRRGETITRVPPTRFWRSSATGRGGRHGRPDDGRDPLAQPPTLDDCRRPGDTTYRSV